MSNEEKKSMKPSRNFFVFYCIILFLFAAVLITFSYLSQARVEQELVDTTQRAEGFASRLEQANAKNADFETTIVEQKAQIDSLTKQLTTANESLVIQEKRALAAELLWSLVKADADKNNDECNAIITKINGDGLRTFLSADGLKELERIEKNTKGE